MNAPSQTLICNPQIERSELLSFSFRPFAFLRDRTSLILCKCVRLIVKEMLKVGRKKKKRKENKETKRERKKVKKQTNSNARTGFDLAPLRQLLASRA